MKFAKIIFNLSIAFFIGLAIYFKVNHITSYEKFNFDGELTNSIITWPVLLLFAFIMIIGRYLIERTDRKQQRIQPSAEHALTQLVGPSLSNREFAGLTTDDRIRAIIQAASHPAKDNSALFLYAIQFDPDLHVRMAALKRVHLFNDNAELKLMMQKMKVANQYKDLEPYFSMALYRMGLISEEELEQIINPQ